MSDSAALQQILQSIKKIAHLQESIEQTGDENTLAGLHSQRDSNLNELKNLLAKLPTLAVSKTASPRDPGINDEPGYPTV